jgi:hypothetical protein
MKELFYYSLIAIILYYILNSIFDKLNLEKETFTPSTTIPNSSLVTLATIAQNLLNTSGTFVNPGNLQIGSNTAPGNLTVTGNTITSGIVSASGNINTGAIAAGQLQIGSWASRPAIWANTSNNPITLHNEGNTKAVQIGASTTYPNNLVVTGNTTSVSGLFGQRVEVSGVGNGYAFYDRTNSNNRFEWYSSGSAAKLYYNPADASKTPIGTTANLFEVDFNGNTSILGNLTVNKNFITNNMLFAPGNIELNNDNPHIIFKKKGGSREPQLYSDGSTLHVYNGSFQADENATINGDLNITGKLKFKGLAAMVQVDFTGQNLTSVKLPAALIPWTSVNHPGKDIVWVYNTGITGDYQASIGWCRSSTRWEPYHPRLVFESGTWRFYVNNSYDNTKAQDEIRDVRVYGFHNKFLNL